MAETVALRKPEQEDYTQVKSYRPMALLNTLASFLTERQTTIKLREATSGILNVETGIPQGSPLSPILYLFFNADLIEKCYNPSNNTGTQVQQNNRQGTPNLAGRLRSEANNKLNWNGHIEHIETKMTKSLGALSSLAGSTWGTGYKGLRQVYQATILPQIIYAASIWYAPLNLEDNHREKAVGKLEAIQKKVARIITEAFKTVSGAALDIEAFLLPI
ncbi:hypothetical protein TSTA_047640 [Talaromyces stipitatus ATCC 10500]|uniref:Reverse transcriptase domain-containing protein n=1 Tax=Talaromyces stipitatus (strain ATCC 10500 / CBS 375.48 / QM 6759 / NRRL 1006) TaxID=441959 RepID=B8MKG3_TALSN|nr:uncharacterized protein TSTA_047640 [Talaromyces stipitatus ATCC 10500]EED15318.1 hypothetical protein TSTA_047640 [Talaromyces stipitatus ATCC 10500]